MMQSSSLPRESLYGLTGAALDAYNAIVRPDLVWGVSIYFLRRWTRILGATGTWLLVALQQQCYKGRGNECMVSRQVLADEASMSEATVHHYLHAREYVASGLCHWVLLSAEKQERRWSAKAGRMVQGINRFSVRIDPPLAPVDQRGLARFLQERLIDASDTLAGLEQTLEHLSNLNLANLLSLLDEHAARFQASESWRAGGFYPTVADVVATLEATADGHKARFPDLCSRVQRKLMGPRYLGTQYFREKWTPLLGHRLALAVVQLRSRCFWNEFEIRNVVPISTEKLAQVSGCDGSFVRKLSKDPRARLFFETLQEGKGRRPSTFRVMLLEPLLEQDRARYEALINGAVISDASTLNAPSLSPVAVTGENSPGQAVTDERLGETVSVNDEHSQSPGVTGERLGGSTDVNSEQHSSTLVLSTFPPIALEPQHTRPVAAVASLLDCFGIAEPGRGRILALYTDPYRVRAWMLFAVAQPGLNANKAGFVIKRLLAGDAPPERFLRWARLAADEWKTLWLATHTNSQASLSPALQGLCNAWDTDLGKLFPDGPFGDQKQVKARDAHGASEPERPPSAPRSELDHIWEMALTELQLQLTDITFQTWLARSKLVAREDTTFVIRVHNSYARDWLKNRLLRLIKRSLASAANISEAEIRVEFVLASETSEQVEHIKSATQSNL